MLEFNNLLTSQLKGAVGTEVVVSHVTVPPNITLAKHWHPGEEFAYILDGSLILWQENEPEQIFSKGDVGVAPWKQVHTVMTKDEGVTILVFRVHEQGQPDAFWLNEVHCITKK